MAITDAEPGLAKIVVVTPQRRLELALPEQLPVASLLPLLVRQGGDDLGTDQEADGGWVLRRPDGSVLEGGLSLAAQAVLDGELLHLVPRRTQWPEVQFDDVVDAIAAGARRGGPAWTPAATRVAGLLAAALTLLAVPVAALTVGADRAATGLGLLGLALVLLAAGTALARALADSLAGAVVAAVAMPCALAGGALAIAGDLPLPGFGASQLLLGSVCLLPVALAGYAGTADLRAVFAAGAVTGLAGAVAAALDLGPTDATGAAAVVITVLLIVTPGLPLLSVRLAKVPMPSVPRDAADLRAGDTLPPLDLVLTQVARSLDLLTGALASTALVTVAGVALLAAHGSTSALLLCGVVSAAHLLRARMLVAVRQRVPLLVAGAAGTAATVAGTLAVLPPWTRFGLLAPLALVAAAALVGSARVFSRRAPSPYLGRAADILDVLLTLAAGPIAASVLGLYARMRGLGG
jgi:type VII secretion integral membrane protein EccD